MELFWQEHKKLWRRNSVKLSAVLCLVYVVILGNVLSFQWFSFGSTDDYTSFFGNRFDGYSLIRKSQEYALGFGEELTDESLQKMVRDYQRIDKNGMEQELEQTDWIAVNSWIEVLWPELKEPENPRLMLSYVEPEKLTGFYDRRKEALETFLEINGQTGKEKEYLLAMDQNVQEPFHYEWVKGWSTILGSVAAEMGVVMALFLAIVLSALFAGEWHDHTGALILTTRNGRRKVACAKIFTGLTFAVELFAAVTVGNIISQIIFFGTAGWDMPVQVIKLIAVAPMNMLQAEIYEYLFTLLGAVGFAGVVMLISAAAKRNVPALLFSMAVAFGPGIVYGYLPYQVQKALDLIPLVGSGADIFRTNTFQIFGKVIWSPYLLITVPVLIGALCIPAAIKSWSARLKV